MTECIIVFRNPGNGVVDVIVKDDDSGGTILYAFANRDDAIAFARDSKLLNAWPFQIVELDEI